MLCAWLPRLAVAVQVDTIINAMIPMVHLAPEERPDALTLKEQAPAVDAHAASIAKKFLNIHKHYTQVGCLMCTGRRCRGNGS